MQNYWETSIFHVNLNSFTGPLIIETFEKRAPGWLRTDWDIVADGIVFQFKHAN